MPVFRLTDDLVFPSPDYASEGLLAVGGDLSVARLLLAYRSGIFPWYSEGEPILWWSPETRVILDPEEVHISRSLRRVLKKGVFRVTCDAAFEAVIRACAETPRKREAGTWITPEMQEAYIALHRAGYAHSVECWAGEALAGGLYGVNLGCCFFGESMFSRQANASKVALAAICAQFVRWGIDLVDCQVENDHLFRLGARKVPRSFFLRMLFPRMHARTRQGVWQLDEDLRGAEREGGAADR